MKKTLKKISRSIHKKFGFDVVISDSWVLKSKIPNANQKQTELLQCFDAPIIFDIGAHIGEAAIKYAEDLPQATIYSFEPFSDSFEKLKENVKSYKNIIPVNIALGDKETTNKLKINKFAATNSFLETHESGKEVWGKDILDTEREIEVKVTTVDKFIAENNIARIHLLKTDTQGYEYQVFKGAEKAMAKKQIDYIYSEIITLTTYKDQKSLEYYLGYMRERDYQLYNFYDLSYKKDGKLRQVDALFYHTNKQNTN